MNVKSFLKWAVVISLWCVAAILTAYLLWGVVLLVLVALVFWPLWWAVLLALCGLGSAIVATVGWVILLRFSTDWCLAVEND